MAECSTDENASKNVTKTSTIRCSYTPKNARSKYLPVNGLNEVYPLAVNGQYLTFRRGQA